MWERLPELRCGWADFDLIFCVLADSDRVPDERMFSLWEWYRSSHPSHAREFRDDIIALSLGAAYDPDHPWPRRPDRWSRHL